MEYIVKLTLQGDFPGSPDSFYYSVDNETWDKIYDLCKKFKYHPTYEEAIKDKKTGGK